jgi:hypothetical protein
MSQLSYPPVQQALDMLKDLSADAETQHRALVRERALHDERTLLQAAEQKGKLEGKLEAKQEALTLMVASGIAEARARAILDLSMDRNQAGRSVGGGGFFGLRARREPPGIA